MGGPMTAPHCCLSGLRHSSFLSLSLTFRSLYRPQETVNNLPKGTNATPPPQWEYLHNHALATLRLYFIGGQLDPTFPPPAASIDDIPVPIERPVKQGNPRRTFVDASAGKSFGFVPPHAALKIPPSAAVDQWNEVLKATPRAAVDQSNPVLKATSKAEVDPWNPVFNAFPRVQVNESEKLASTNPFKKLNSAAVKSRHEEGSRALDETDRHCSDDARFRALLAVRDQLDMLHKFKGIMSEKEMSSRRRDLYESMPPIPPPTDPLSAENLGDSDTSPQQKRAAL
jgi:hypothetical protein